VISRLETENSWTFFYGVPTSADNKIKALYHICFITTEQQRAAIPVCCKVWKSRRRRRSPLWWFTVNSKCSLSIFPAKSSLSEDCIPGMVVKAVKNLVLSLQGRSSHMHNDRCWSCEFTACWSRHSSLLLFLLSKEFAWMYQGEGTQPPSLLLSSGPGSVRLCNAMEAELPNSPSLPHPDS
jgi:hypothetical protein